MCFKDPSELTRPVLTEEQEGGGAIAVKPRPRSSLSPGPVQTDAVIGQIVGLADSPACILDIHGRCMQRKHEARPTCP